MPPTAEAPRDVAPSKENSKRTTIFALSQYLAIPFASVLFLRAINAHPCDTVIISTVVGMTVLCLAVIAAAARPEQRQSDVGGDA